MLLLQLPAWPGGNEGDADTVALQHGLVRSYEKATASPHPLANDAPKHSTHSAMEQGGPGHDVVPQCHAGSLAATSS